MSCSIQIDMTRVYMFAKNIYGRKKSDKVYNLVNI